MSQFTDVFLKALKVQGKAYRVSEGRGFSVWVHPTGTKTFQYRFKFQGKDAAMVLGNYPEVSLKVARSKFNKCYDALHSGSDPRTLVFEGTEVIGSKETGSTLSPQETEAPEEITISKLLDLFITKWSEKYHSKRWSRANRLCLEKDLIPKWGDRKAADFKPKDAYELIDEVAVRAPASARNIIKAGSAMYDYGMRMEYVEFNPFNLKFSKHTPKIKPRKRERVLDEKEIKFLWGAIEEGPGTPEVKRALKLILVTAQRPSEVAGMRFSEIDGDWWTIPANRIKTEKRVGLDHEPRPHVVYLTGLAKGLIGKPGWSPDVVFPTIKGHNKRKVTVKDIVPIEANAICKRVVKRDLHGKGKEKVVVKEPYYGLPRWTPHDLRRTASTLMNAIGVPDRHVEMVLNHSLGKVEGIYNRYEYNEEKKGALLRWEKKLTSIVGK